MTDLCGVKQNDPSIVLFDGICNLCNASIAMIIRNDPHAHFRFAPLQSQIGKQYISEMNIEVDGSGSLVLIQNDQYYLRSEAALRIARKMDRPWNWLWVFIIIPPPIRDLVYRIVSKYRYNWFGKKGSCMVPTEDVKSRFLELTY